MECEISGIPTKFLIDSGSSVNIINKPTWEELKLKKIRCKTWKTAGVIKAYGGQPVDILGKFAAPIRHRDKVIDAEFVVFDGDAPSILSCAASVELELMSFNVNTVSENKNKAISGFSVNIPMPEDCTLPFLKARPIPYGLQDAVKERLDDLETRGIITKVDSATNATPIVVVQKKSVNGKPGGVRLCGDYKMSVNKFVKQVPTQNLNVNDLLAKIGDAKFFSRLDLEGAYLQLELDEMSKNVTTINTLFGLYQYERLPYGISASPGIFEGCILKILDGLPGILSYMDDILVMGRDEKEHDKNLKALMKRLESHNVRVNEKKSEFKKTEIEFLGHTISQQGLTPNRSAVDAIKAAKYPADKKELQSWLGSIQFYGKYVRNLADKTSPLYNMLRKNVPFKMNREAKAAIDVIKESLSSPLVLKPYQPDQPVVLTCDASQKGIAGIIEQNGHPVMAVSKILTRVEQNYSQIEREALAIVWSVKKLSKYLLNRHFRLVTDHKPLKFIFGKQKGVNSITAARIQRWAITLMAYDFDIECAKSEDMHLADLLSRCGNIEGEDANEVNMLWRTPMPQIQKKLTSLMQQPKWNVLKEYIRTGFPKNMDARLVKFKPFAQDLTIENELVYKGCSVVIPEELQHIVLNEIHGDHVGMERGKSFARAHFFWPGMNKAIETMTKNCPTCASLKPKSSNSKQWSPWPEARRPFERVHIDFGEINGKPFLVLVDSFTKWPEIFATPDMTELTLINTLRNVFARFGIPETLVSDNGPSLIAKGLEQWLFNCGCEHITSAEYHPKSNGLAERMVRSFKEHVRVNRAHNISVAADRFLIGYQSIPHKTTGVSPANLMFGRSIRTSSVILQNTGFYKLPLKKEYEFGDLVNKRGKMMELQNADGVIVRRHEEQVKLKREDHETQSSEEEANEGLVEENNTEIRGENAVTSSEETTEPGVALTRPIRKPKPVRRFIHENYK